MPTADNFAGDDPTDEPPPCQRCGRIHYRNGRRTCTSHHRDGSGMPCMKFPIEGGTVCMDHGGAAPQVQSAAEWNLFNKRVRRKAAAALTTFGDEHTPPPDDLIDPVHELLMLVWRKKMAERFWAERVAELEIPDPGDHIRVQIVGEGDDAQPMEVLGDVTAIIGPDRFGELRLHPYIRAWNEAVRDLAKVSKAAIDAGIEERMTRLAEDQGAIVEALIRSLIEKIEVSPGVPLSSWSREHAFEVAGRELREIG